MGRGKYYSWWRRYGEMALALMYQGGWAAKAAYQLGLQGKLHIDVRTIPVQPHCLPKPLKIALISDLHAGPLTSPRLIEKVFASIRDFAPHLVLMGGDYVSLHHRHISTLVPELEQLQVPCGIIGVLGNHDLWVDDQALCKSLANTGVSILINQTVHLPAPFDQVEVYGLDDPGTGSPDETIPRQSPGKLRIAIMHSPLGLRQISPDQFDFGFCGHTHGGQIAWPSGKPIILPMGSGERRLAHGFFELAAQGGRLLVSKGVGMSDLPIRLFADSELHLVTLIDDDGQQDNSGNPRESP